MGSQAKLILFITIFLHINLGITQTNVDDKVKEYLNLNYLEEDARQDTIQKLNLFIPQKSKQFPLFIWIGGGAWSYGNKDEESDFARQLANRGIAVACIGHRLSAAIWKDPKLKKGVQHPKHVQDVADAVSWLYKNAIKYGYDKNSLFIGGYSSGAHLSTLIGLDEKYLKKKELSTKIFRGIVPISGTYDITDYHSVFLRGERPELAVQHVESVFGSDQKNWVEGSPVTYLENLSAPVLLMCDNSLYNYTKLFEERIRETEFRKVSVLYAYDLSHGELWRNLSRSQHSIYREAIIGFIQSLIDQ